MPQFLWHCLWIRYCRQKFERVVVSHEYIQQNQQGSLENDFSLLSTYLKTWTSELSNGWHTSPPSASMPRDGKCRDQGPHRDELRAMSLLLGCGKTLLKWHWAPITHSDNLFFNTPAFFSASPCVPTPVVCVPGHKQVPEHLCLRAAALVATHHSLTGSICPVGFCVSNWKLS